MLTGWPSAESYFAMVQRTVVHFGKRDKEREKRAKEARDEPVRRDRVMGHSIGPCPLSNCVCWGSAEEMQMARFM